MITTSHFDIFRQEIEKAGLTPPATIIADGKLHRFASNGDRTDDAGWYVLYDDGLLAGSFGDWRSGIKQNWCVKSDRQMSVTEREVHRTRLERARHQREADERLRHVDAALRAQAICTTPYQRRDSIHIYRRKVLVHTACELREAESMTETR